MPDYCLLSKIFLHKKSFGREPNINRLNSTLSQIASALEEDIKAHGCQLQVDDVLRNILKALKVDIERFPTLHTAIWFPNAKRVDQTSGLHFNGIFSSTQPQGNDQQQSNSLLPSKGLTAHITNDQL